MSFIVGGAILGAGVIGAFGSYEAGKQQANAAENATNAQEAMFNEQQQNLAPWRTAGGQAQTELNYLEGIGPNNGKPGVNGGYGSLNKAFNLNTFKSLTPQYQFNLEQGAQGTLNQASSAQGAESGSALSALQSYNQNYANNSFNSAFQNYQSQQNNIFNRLSTISQTGESAASNQASGASTFAGGIGTSLQNIGTAQAGGTSGIANNLGSSALLGALYGGNQGTGAGGIGSDAFNSNIVSPSGGLVPTPQF